MKEKAVLVGALAIAFLASSCSYQVATGGTDGIRTREMRSPASLVFVHIDEEHYLKIHRRMSRDVTGGKPYYLELPKLGSILFVTGTVDHGNVKFHIVNKETGSSLAINAGKLYFGSNIGAPRKPGQVATEFVLEEGLGEVKLASQGRNAHEVITLDLASSKVKNVTLEHLKADE